MTVHCYFVLCIDIYSISKKQKVKVVFRSISRDKAVEIVFEKIFEKKAEKYRW